MWRKNKQIQEMLPNHEYSEKLRNYQRALLRSCLLMFVSLVTLIFGTVAWFTNNKNVSGENAMISMEVPVGLYIMPSGETTKDFLSNASVSFSSKKLFPISTVDCADWYYVSKVTNGAASKYTKVTFTDNAAKTAGIYLNQFEKANKYAYSMAKFVVYTDYGDINVYLDPENPIVVDFGDTKADNDLAHVDESIRVGIVAKGDSDSESLLLVYAPKAESGKGNSRGQNTSDVFYAVGGTEISGLQTVGGANSPYVLTIGGVASGTNSLNTYTAVAVEDSNAIYQTTANSKKICTATSGGTEVTVYVWMEGTDAQAVIDPVNHQNYLSEKISVKVNLAGIDVED